MSEGRFVLRSVKRRKASHGRYGSGIMITCREKYVHKKLYLLQRDKQLLPLLAMPLQGEKKTSKLNFLMPSLEVVRRAHELLERICGVQQEEKEMVDILFLETCVRSVTERKAVKSLKRLLIDSSDCFVLLNEQSSVTFSPPKHHQLMASKDDSVEDEETHRLRLMAESCSLLLSSFPSSYAAAFLVLHESHDPLALLCQQLSLPFTTLQSHLENLVAKKLLPESVLTELSQLMTTILPSNSSSSSSKGAAIYSPYLSESAIQKGLASSELFIGTLTIYPHTNREEGEVEVTNALDSRIFLISGKLPLNRALDGDEVVVRKLPPLSSSSCRKPSRLLEDIMNEEDDNNEVMVRNSSPSPAYLGLDYVEVVGIRRRMERDIMARIPFSAPKNFHPQSLMEEEEEGREEAVLVCPLDRRLPKIRVRTKQRAFLSSQRFLVTINSWSIDSQYPNGHISHILGPCNDWRVEVKCLLQENSLHPKPFSLQALACLPSIPSQSFSNASSDESKLMEGVPSGIAKKWVDSNFILSQELLRGRRDFRKDRVVFSVDPPGCQDIDDAMSLEWLGPDLIEVGVHIADVCAFVAHKSALDLEARQRGTTIYLPHERYNMLPSLLSSDIASLHAHKDRLTMSVLWHVRVVALESSKRGGVLPMDDILNLYTEGKLIFELPDTPEWIGRGVICSTAAATYLQAHYLMHENAPFSQKKREKEMEKEVPLGQAGRQIDRKHWSRLSSDLRCLTALGMHLQKGREAAGALDLSQGSGAELKFALDAEGAPVEVHGKEEMQIHKTISELMVLANATVAKFVFDFFPTSTLLRIHPPPSGDKLRLLHEEISQTGLEVFQQNASSTEMRQQLKIYRELFARKKENQSDISSEAAIDLLTGVIIQSMNEARYVGSGALSGDLVSSSGSLAESAAEGRLIGHYGLGLAFYTHFTSPIRRYADIMVHRQLLRALEATNTMSRMEDGNLKDIVSSVDAMNEQVEGGSEREEGNGEADVDNDDDLDFLDSLLEDVEDGLVMSSSPTQKDESSLQAIRNEASFDAAPKEEKNGDKTGEEVVPYSAAELHTISEHLNTMNRRSKSAQFACQKLFLCLYFVGKSEIHEGLVHSLKENGFWAFIPVFNYRGPVYLSKQDKRANAITTNEELYSCSPSYSSDNKISELMVTELGGKGGIAFRLLPLQRVLLQVSSDEYLSHRELNLKFVSTSSASSMVSKTARVDDFIQEVIQEKINGVESLSSVSLRGTRDAFPSSEDVSLYNMIRSASTNPAQAPMGRQVSILSHRLSNVWYKCSGESPSTNTTLSIAKHQQIEKTYKKKPCSTLCHHIRGSGRFSYGPVDRTKSIYLGKGDALEYEAKLKLNADRVKLQLKSGHAAAQVRMDGWGEEWAEEEDLLSYSEGGVSSSSAPLAAGIMSKSLAKEVSISSQRIAKLKVAKKNSKYS